MKLRPCLKTTNKKQGVVMYPRKPHYPRDRGMKIKNSKLVYATWNSVSIVLMMMMPKTKDTSPLPSSKPGIIWGVPSNKILSCQLDQIERCLEKLPTHIKVLSVRLFVWISKLQEKIYLLMSTALSGGLGAWEEHVVEDRKLPGGKVDFSRVGTNFCCCHCFERGHHTALTPLTP